MSENESTPLFKMYQMVKIVTVKPVHYPGMDKLVGTIGEIIDIDEDDDPPYIVGFADGDAWPFYADELAAYSETPAAPDLNARIAALEAACRDLLRNHAALVNHVFPGGLPPLPAPDEEATLNLRLRVIDVLNGEATNVDAS